MKLLNTDFDHKLLLGLALHFLSLEIHSKRKLNYYLKKKGDLPKLVLIFDITDIRLDG